MKSDLVQALYEYFIIRPPKQKSWVMIGKSGYCGCKPSRVPFVSADGNTWHIHESNERPIQFVIPFDLFMKDEFNTEG